MHSPSDLRHGTLLMMAMILMTSQSPSTVGVILIIMLAYGCHADHPILLMIAVFLLLVPFHTSAVPLPTQNPPLICRNNRIIQVSYLF